ncbi:hypothetical protein MGP2080_14871 [marine gamma proteobacterium HTCC2080]|nr:hypothetical protein MGP2080_14871 [marine gamma proteobacterium HTCC2080]
MIADLTKAALELGFEAVIYTNEAS